MTRIGELLVAEGRLSQAAVNRALGFQRLSGSAVRLGTILVTWDLLDEESLLAALARLHRCEPVSWLTLESAPVEVVRLLPAAAAIRLGAIPYARARGAMRVAFHNPSNLAAVDEVQVLLGQRILPGVTSEVRLLQAHQKFYGRHIPREFRAVLQKLRRKSPQTLPAPEAPGDLDFRARDLLVFERRGASSAAPSNAALPRAAERASGEGAVTKIPVVAGTGLPPPPDFYSPEPPEPGAGIVGDFVSPSRTEQEGAAEQTGAKPHTTAAETSPLLAAPVAEPAARAHGEERQVGEVESLSEWVGDALGRLQAGAFAGPAGATPSSQAIPDTGPIPSLGSGAEGGLEKPKTSGTAPTAGIPFSLPAPGEERQVSGMWRSSLLKEEENDAVSGMWTAAQVGGSSGWEAQSREEIAQAAVKTYLTGLPRVLFLDSGKAGIVAWHGRGESVGERVAEFRIARHERSVFRHVLRSGAPHFGPLERELWPRSFAKILGPAAPNCAVFPIRVSEDVAAFLYADRLGAPMRDPDFGALAGAAAWVGKALSRLLSRSDRSSPVPSG